MAGARGWDWFGVRLGQAHRHGLAVEQNRHRQGRRAVNLIEALLYDRRVVQFAVADLATSRSGWGG